MFGTRFKFHKSNQTWLIISGRLTGRCTQRPGWGSHGSMHRARISIGRAHKSDRPGQPGLAPVGYHPAAPDLVQLVSQGVTGLVGGSGADSAAGMAHSAGSSKAKSGLGTWTARWDGRLTVSQDSLLLADRRHNGHCLLDDG